MDKSLIKLLPYTKPYKSHIIWNVVFNVLYALFSTISMLTLLPVLEVLLGKTRAVLTKPTYTGIGDIKQFGTDYMYYQISTLTKDNSIQVALLFVVLMVITTFLLKTYSIIWLLTILCISRMVSYEFKKDNV
jgi:subfamily B ATP-binding cassette protein MsbA